MDTKAKIRNIEVYIIEILHDYTNWLCQKGYTDSDVYTEEPKAVDAFWEEINRE